MSTHRHPSDRPSGSAAEQRPPLSGGVKTLLGLLLGVPILLPLLVPLYAHESPDLGGMPFYFWAQFAMIPFTALLTSTAYLVVRRREGTGAPR